MRKYRSNLQSRFQMGVRLPMFQRPEGDEKIAYISRVLSLADYFSLPNLTVSATVLGLAHPAPPHPEISYPYGAAMYRLLFAGKLGYAMESEFTRYPGLFGWEINDDPIDFNDPEFRYRCDQSFSLRQPPQNNPVPEP